MLATNVGKKPVQNFRRQSNLRYFKVALTGVLAIEDGDSHPENWDWGKDFLPMRVKDMGNTIKINFTEMREVTEIDPAA
jgi:hypothetical protein|tara:strand:- start:353 stop:589 length:237 start_codon:yes stop_codon:yes gene_type:complete